MFSRMFFITMTMATMTVVVVTANNVAAAAGDCVRFHDAGQFSEADALDKTWTTGRRENDNGSQVLCYKALASRVSFGAERTGFEKIPVTRYTTMSWRIRPTQALQPALQSMANTAQSTPIWPK